MDRPEKCSLPSQQRRCLTVTVSNGHGKQDMIEAPDDVLCGQPRGNLGGTGVADPNARVPHGRWVPLVEPHLHERALGYDIHHIGGGAIDLLRIDGDSRYRNEFNLESGGCPKTGQVGLTKEQGSADDSKHLRSSAYAHLRVKPPVVELRGMALAMLKDRSKLAKLLANMHCRIVARAVAIAWQLG